jgi:hypothetical protein
MTGPINIETIVPKKWKPWVATVSSLLAFAVPYVIQAEQWLPDPWPVVIGFVIAALTWLGVYRAPYVPEGAVLAPDTPAVASAAQATVTETAIASASLPSHPGVYVNPFR